MTLLIERELIRLRATPYEELKHLIDHAWTETVSTPSGHNYQVEIQAVWDDRKRRNIRVVISVDDMGWRAFAPLSSDFIIAPDGSFVGE